MTNLEICPCGIAKADCEYHGQSGQRCKCGYTAIAEDVFCVMQIGSPIVHAVDKCEPGPLAVGDACHAPGTNKVVAKVTSGPTQRSLTCTCGQWTFSSPTVDYHYEFIGASKHGRRHTRDGCNSF